MPLNKFIRKSFLTFLALFVWNATPLFSQNELDVFRYSQLNITGTARSLAMGGANSAVGADFSSASINPAGLAFYKRSDLMFSPAFKSSSNNTDFLNQSQSINRTNFGIANLGYVYAYNYTDSEEQSPRKGAVMDAIAFGIGYNQLANYWRDTKSSGTNTYNSITDYFAQSAQGQNYSNLSVNSPEGLGFYCWLIDTLGGSPSQYQAAAANGNVYQEVLKNETGRLNEWTLSAAVNLDQKIMVGVSVGILDLRYTSLTTITETDFGNVHGYYNVDSISFYSMEYNDQFTTKGTGINARFGIIFKPADAFRAGFSIQTPTSFSMEDSYSSNMTHYTDTGEKFSYESDPGLFNYNMTTPYRVNGGLAFLINKKFTLCADVEYTDYRNSHLKAAGYTFQAQNQAIKNYFTTGMTYKAGMEYRINTYYLRGGYAYATSALNSRGLEYSSFTTPSVIRSIDGNRQFITLGFGYRPEGFYIDLAGVYNQAQNKYALYSIENNTPQPIVVNNTNSLSIITTFGFRF